MRRTFLTVCGAVALAATLACSDALEQDTTSGQFVVVVNAGSGDLTLVSATSFDTLIRPLGAFGGVPGAAAGRDDVLLVSLSAIDTLVVRAFESAGPPGGVVPLAVGSGAADVVVQDDSIAWVANPERHRVTRVNYRTGDTASVSVGTSPYGLALVGATLFVANANLAGGATQGLAWLSVVTTGPGAPAVTDSIPLTVTNARHVVLGGDGLLYVVGAGTVGRADGRLAIVDPATRTELVVINGLGESPGQPVYHPAGRLLVAAGDAGILEINAVTRTLVRGPGAGLRPEGDGIVALAVDTRGRVYAVAPQGCAAPGVVHILSAPPDMRLRRTVPVGTCPAAAATVVVFSLPAG